MLSRTGSESSVLFLGLLLVIECAVRGKIAAVDLELVVELCIWRLEYYSVAKTIRTFATSMNLGLITMTTMHVKSDPGTPAEAVAAAVTTHAKPCNI